MPNLSTINAELESYDRYYWQWFDTRRGTWITPNNWLASGGFATLAQCADDVEAERKRVKGVRIRVIKRSVSQVEIDV